MGGAENVALGLIESLEGRVDSALFAVLRQGEPSQVGREMAGRLDRWGVPYRFGTAVGFKRGGVLLAARALARMVAELRPDVLHVHTEIPELTTAVATLMSRRVRATPLLRTVHNSTLWIDWARIGTWVTDRLAPGMAVAVSDDAADADAAIATRSARPRAAVIHNGVRPPPDASPRPPGGPARVLFAGRLVHQKGADLLPAILTEAHARTRRRDVAVQIAGTGPLRDAVAAGLDGRLPGWSVSVTDPIPGLSARLGEQDVVLLPSRFEGFPLLALEVLMAGVPLVTTEAPGLRLALPFDYPFKAEPGDCAALGGALAAVLDDPAAARTAAKRHGADVAGRFSPDAMASAYRARYRALAGVGAGTLQAR